MNVDENTVKEYLKRESLNLEDIKEYILEEGKSYRKNILIYLSWVLEDFDSRETSLAKSIIDGVSKQYPDLLKSTNSARDLIIEGVRTNKEWARINQNELNNYLVHHLATPGGHSIKVKLQKNELVDFMAVMEAYIPKTIELIEYPQPTKSDLEKAIKDYESYNLKPINSKYVARFKGKEFQTLTLGRLAYAKAAGISNDTIPPYPIGAKAMLKHIERLGVDGLEFEEVEVTKAAQREKEFKAWLGLQSKPGPSGVGSYINSLKGTKSSAATLISECEAPKNIFESNDLNLLKELLLAITTRQRLIELSNNEGGFFKAGLVHYIRFIEESLPSLNEDNATSSPGNNLMKNSSLNQIFYGPPGTGKTFELQKLLKDSYTDKPVFPDHKTWLMDKLEKLSWFEIVVLVLLKENKPMTVPEVTDHEYFQLKVVMNRRDANISQTAWAALQTHTILESQTVKYQTRVEPAVFDKSQDSTWFIVEDRREQLAEYQELLKGLNIGPRQKETIKRFEFVTFHQSYGYEEFIEGLRPVTNSAGDISYEVKPGVFKRLCERAESDPENKYAMVIDEINRGNISKIFGELITLVETDKRAGAANALQVTLPYSNSLFSVPSNVDIIGSMNTADRSLTHIDVALRRRFDFKELRTNYSLIESNVKGVNLRHMLFAMNQRIELLLDRDHILGHALLMKVTSFESLEHAFKTNILPLLEEYFFENWEKIGQVLGRNGFIEEQKGARDIWLEETDDYGSKSYFINESALNNVEAYKSIYSKVDASYFTACDKDAVES